MGYETFAELCRINNLKPADVSRATGIATSTLTNWKKGNYTPKQDKLYKIANFFNVSIEYLTIGKEPEKKGHTVLTFEEESIIKAYRALDESQKELVCQMLGIKRDLLLFKGKEA